MNPTELERIVAHVRKVAANEGGIRCGVCARDVSGMASVCTRCEAPFHADCWEYNGGCAVYGCQVAPCDPLRLDVALLKPPPPVAGGRAALLALAVAGFLVTLPALVTRYLTVRPAAMRALAPSPVTRAAGNFTVRVGGPGTAEPGKPAPRETTIEARILVIDELPARELFATGCLPRALDHTRAYLLARLAVLEHAGQARTVASPRLMSLEGRETFVLVGKRLMFTGSPDAEREPGSLQIRFRPVNVGPDGVDLGVAAGTATETLTAAAYGRPVLALLSSAALANAPAFFERWAVPARPGQAVAVLLTAYQQGPAAAPRNPFGTR